MMNGGLWHFRFSQPLPSRFRFMSTAMDAPSEGAEGSLLEASQPVGSPAAAESEDRGSQALLDYLDLRRPMV